jgi:hypothetical protein
MPGTIISTPTFRTIEVKQLHPTFGAEVSGADFKNMSDEQLEEIKRAMAKVRFARVLFVCSRLLHIVQRACLSQGKFDR